MIFGRYIAARLRRVLLPELQRAWTKDVNASLKDVRETLSAVQAELGELRQLRLAAAVREWETARAPLASRVDSILRIDAIRDHVAAAVEHAKPETSPTAHLVIDNVLPPDFYDLLVAAIPPQELFSSRDPVKQDFEMEGLGQAPALSRRVWEFFDRDVVAGVLAPAVLGRLKRFVVAHYAETGGDEFGMKASKLEHQPVAGRIQLRRPGYHLAPHLDPKRVVITGLLYFPRPGDTEAFGTQLFNVDRPFVASGLKTFFPEEAGLTCTLAKTVPYRANTLLAFVNSRAAHGATLPAGAPLAARYAFQFYVKPVDRYLRKLLRTLPADAQSAWGELA